MLWLLCFMSLAVGSHIKIIARSASADLIKSMGCTQWSTWGCPKSKFDWTYSDQETAYLIKGLVTVTPKNKSVFGDAVTVKAGDIVTFPAGMDCVWDVQEDLHKHYRFD